MAHNESLCPEGNLKNKNSAEVNIAPAFGEITTACNVGQAKKGHGACLTKSVEREIKVKGTRSRCLLKECVKDNYYARFHPHSYHCCKEINFISRLDVNFLDLTQNIDRVSGV